MSRTTKLRDNLTAAKGEHLAQHYPGDLAGDVLDRASMRVMDYQDPGSRRRWTPFQITVVATGIAASIALFIGIVVTIMSRLTSDGWVVIVDPAPANESVSLVLNEVPEMPSNLPSIIPSAGDEFETVVPSYQSILIQSISFSDLTNADVEENEDTSATTQEPV